MSRTLHSWKEKIVVPGWGNWFFSFFGIKVFDDVYEAIIRMKETEDGKLYYSAWISLPVPLKDEYEFETGRDGHLIAADTYGSDQEAQYDLIKWCLLSIIEEHRKYADTYRR